MDFICECRNWLNSNFITGFCSANIVKIHIISFMQQSQNVRHSQSMYIEKDFIKWMDV